MISKELLARIAELEMPQIRQAEAIMLSMDYEEVVLLKNRLGKLQEAASEATKKTLYYKWATKMISGIDINDMGEDSVGGRQQALIDQTIDALYRIKAISFRDSTYTERKAEIDTILGEFAQGVIDEYKRNLSSEEGKG